MCLQWLSWLRYHNQSDFIRYFERFCMFSQGVSWGWNHDSRGGGGWGVERKKIPGSLSLVMTPCNTPLIFTLLSDQSADLFTESGPDSGREFAGSAHRWRTTCDGKHNLWNSWRRARHVMPREAAAFDTSQPTDLILSSPLPARSDVTARGIEYGKRSRAGRKTWWKAAATALTGYTLSLVRTRNKRRLRAKSTQK